jgi:phage/plasmid-like protein (TIGR03299 family)
MIMSQETMQWLNENVLIGFTEKRGTAWHYRASDQGAEPNHYAGAIPVADVLRRLFHWHAVEARTFFEIPNPAPGSLSVFTPDGGTFPITRSEKKTIIRSDTFAELGAFKEGYQPHQYDEWLINNVATLLDTSRGDLGISSAGLLKGGAVAWVEVSIPDTITTPEGVAFRPNLLASTSFNGSLATTIGRKVQATVCDNTLSLALAEKGQQVKIKHSRKSMGKIGDVREALEIVHTIEQDFRDAVATLTSIKVDDVMFEKALDMIQPLPKPGDATKNAITLAERKREAIQNLWLHDERAASWRGTAYGVWAALNTYGHHVQTVKGTSRPERNMLNALNGTTERNDAEALQMILSLAA